MINKKDVEQKINEIRPSLQADGGDIKLVEVTDDGVVKVELQGACKGCPMATITLKQGVEAYLKKAISEVKEVVATNNE